MMDRRPTGSRRGPGRPAKFGRPARVVAFTLPEDAIDRLRRVHRDLGWAVVKLLDGQAGLRAGRDEGPPEVELVDVADRRSLIVVNREVIKNLPGVHVVPLDGRRAFLALEIDRGMSDLELAVSDRLADTAMHAQERQALSRLQTQLRAWRRDGAMRAYTRAIIVVERDRPNVGPRRPARPRVAGGRARSGHLTSS